MASRFWVGGTGTWDAADTTHWAATSGGAGGETVPTSSDTVTFDSNSGTTATVTINTATANCSSLTLNKSDLTLTQSAALVVAGTLMVTTGTYDSNGQTVTCHTFDSQGASTRSVTLGASTLNITSICQMAGAGMTFSGASATVNVTGANGLVTGTSSVSSLGTLNFNDTSGNTNAAVSTCSLVNLSVGVLSFTPQTAVTGKSYALSLATGASGTITTSFTVVGKSETNRAIVRSLTLGTASVLTLTGATVHHTNVDFRDITYSGSPTVGTTSSVGNALGNTGITFTTPVTRYAVATGNVSGTGTWSATSGGASGASVPLCHDTIILNAASGAITVTNDMPRMCADLTCTGYTGTLTGAVNAEVYGSPTLGSGMTFAGDIIWRFFGRSSHTITSAGKTWVGRVYVDAATGTYTLADALTCSRSSGDAVSIITGTFNDGGFAITITGAAGGYSLYGGTTTFSGTTTIASTTQATPWNYISTSTVNHTGTIVLSGATATDRTFAGGGKTYGTLTDQNTSTGKLTITGANTFGTINKTATVACTLALPTSSGITVTGEFLVRGISGAVLTLTGDVTKAGGTVSCDYLAISSSDATGGATFYAGANSTDGGTNTGWIFGAPSGGRPYKGGTATVKESDIEGALVIL